MKQFRKTLFPLILIASLVACSGKHSTQQAANQKAIDMNDKAVSLMIQSKTDSAILLFNQAIATDPAYYLPHVNKTSIYMQQKAYNKALAEAELATGKNAGYAEGWTICGVLNEAIGNPAKAKECYKKGIEVFTQRMNDPEKKENYPVNLLNRALAKKMAGDSSFTADVDEYRKSEQNLTPIDSLWTKSNEEIIQQFFKIDGMN